jgi:hypothetical protein
MEVNMKLVLPVTEAVSLASAARPLPAMIKNVRAEGSAIEADIDAGQVTGGSGLKGLLGKAAGTVTVTATFTGYEAGTALFGLKAHARGLSVEGMLGQFAGTLTRVVRRAGLPADVVELRTTDDRAQLVVHVQRGVDAKVSGVLVQDLFVQDGQVHLDARIGQVQPV